MNEWLAGIGSFFGLTAIIAGMIALHGSRQRTGLVISIIGLTILSAALVWRARFSPRIAALTTQVAEFTAEGHLQRGLVAEATAKLLASETKIEESSAAWHAQAIAVHEATTAATRHLSQFGLREAAGVPAPRPSDPAQAQMAGTLSILKHLGMTTPTPSADILRMMRSLAKLADARHRKALGNGYEIIPETNSEVILRSAGTYYVVRLLDPETRQPLLFGDRKYAFAKQQEPLVRAAVASLVSDVIGELQKQGILSIYVRGGADARTANMPWDEETIEVAGELQVLKRAGADQYLSSPEPHRWKRNLTNDDLPNLRAAHLLGYFKDLMPVDTIRVLDNAPSQIKSREFQFAEIVLFVPW